MIHYNKTKDFFMNICRLACALSAQNYWYEDLNVPLPLKLLHLFYSYTIAAVSVTLILLQWGVFFTDQNLTVKQSFDVKVFSIVHSLAFVAVVIAERKKKKIGELFKWLVVDLKEVYNDETVEKDTLKKVKVTMMCSSGMMFLVLFLYGLDGCIQVKKGHTFVTMVTAYPDVEDPSRSAYICRFIVYVVWIFLCCRLNSVLFITIPMSICLSYQYKQLASYFRKLQDIFNEDCSQEEKEMKFEKAFKVGIQLHSDTIKCTSLMQEHFKAVFGCYIIFRCLGLMALLSSMVNAERTLSHLAPTMVTASYGLITLGFLILNAGNITEEASILPSAVFGSGWQHCTHKTTRRIRSLVVFAIVMSQRPVELKCLGFVTLSYGSYVTIVKSVYSGFSVLY